MPRCCLAVFSSLVLGFLSATQAAAQNARPADSLFRLVPADAGVTLAVEDLRGLARSFWDSPLPAGLKRLPAVQAWLASDQFRGFAHARRQVEHLLGEKIATLRDDLFGDAVVLALRLPPNGRQEEARGLLLTRVRDRGLLDRLIQELNAAQQKNGELVRVVERTRDGSRYWHREFGPRADRPGEYYAIFDDNTFAWSNSEELVQGVIDRRANESNGLAADENFRKVRGRLPARGSISLFLNPRFLEAMMAAAAKPPKPNEERVAAMLGRYVGALEYVGASITWRDDAAAQGVGLVMNIEESLDPSKLTPWLRQWAARPSFEPDLSHVPERALAVASLSLDFEALESLLRDLTPSDDQHKLDNLFEVASGLLLGLDVKSAVLPALRPGALVYAAAPIPNASRPGPTIVAKLSFKNDPRIPGALANALRTVLAVYALDGKHGNGQLRIETREIRGTKLTALNSQSPLAYAVTPTHLIVGLSVEAVEEALNTDGSRAHGFLALRAAYFPTAETFACADLTALHRFAVGRRAAFARRLAAKNSSSLEEAERDLDQVLALVGLFRGAFVTSALAPDAKAVHRSLGLIVRDAAVSP